MIWGLVPQAVWTASALASDWDLAVPGDPPLGGGSKSEEAHRESRELGSKEPLLLYKFVFSSCCRESSPKHSGKGRSQAVAEIPLQKTGKLASKSESIKQK